MRVLLSHSSKVSYDCITQVLSDVGQKVAADEVIARIETDKVTVDILSKYSGVITKFHAEIGDTVEVGANFVDIDPDAAPGAATPAAPQEKKAAPATPVS